MKNVDTILKHIFEKPVHLLISHHEIAYLKEMDKKKGNYEAFYEFVRQDERLFRILKKAKGVELECQRSFLKKNIVQQGMFHECNVLSTFASIFNLDEVINLQYDNVAIPDDIVKNIPHNAKYLYFNSKKTDTYLYHVSGSLEIDAIFYYENTPYRIEIKDIKAKSGEIDIDSYTEAGKLSVSSEFEKRYPEYIPIINDFNEKDSIFNHIGNNIPILNDDNKEEVLNAYFQRNDIDILLTITDEDILVGLTKKDIHLFDTIGSEIRSSGRNSSFVFTPKALNKILQKNQVVIENGRCIAPSYRLLKRIGRGTDEKVTGYKISNFFFVRIEKTIIEGRNIVFLLKDIKQLKPTLSIHLTINYCFKNLRWNFYNNHLGILNEEDEMFSIAEQMSLFDTYI